LGAIAVGCAVVPRRNVAALAILAGASVVPDLDLLVGAHRGITHSLGMAIVAGIAATAVTRTPRWGAAIALAWSSHVLLDWLGNDTRPPLGVMALWPLTRDYYKAAIELFPAVSRRYWLAEFWVYNLKAVAVELAIMLPVVAVTLWLTRRRGARRRRNNEA
jgi:membrane-bound metal-dependent hydrolase YbcI (DUF457 family)